MYQEESGDGSYSAHGQSLPQQAPLAALSTPNSSASKGQVNPLTSFLFVPVLTLLVSLSMIGCKDNTPLQLNPDNDHGDSTITDQQDGADDGSLLVQPTIIITEPDDGDVTAASTITVRGTVEPVDTIVQVNGQTARVNSRGDFTIQLQLPDGSNVIEAVSSATEHTDSASSGPVHITVDTTPPMIRFAYPPRGLQLLPMNHDSQSGKLQFQDLPVAGWVTDAVSAVDSVSLGGQAVPFNSEDGLFEITLPITEAGLRTIEMEARDSLGNSGNATRSLIAGLFLHTDEPVPHSLGLLAGTEAFNIIAQVLEDYLRNVDLAQMLAGAAGEGTGDGEAIQIHGVTFDEIIVALIPDTGFIRAGIILTNLHVEATIEQSFMGIPLTLEGYMDATAVNLEVPVFIIPSSQGGLTMITGDASVLMDGFTYDFGLLLDLIEPLVADLVRTTVETGLTSGLSNLQLDNIIPPEMLTQCLNLFGKSLCLQFMVTETDVVDATGAIIIMEGDAQVLPRQLLVPETSGSYSDGEVNNTPALPPSGTAAVSVTFDYLNRVLHQIWWEGMMNLRIGVKGDINLPMDFNWAFLNSALGDILPPNHSPDTPVDLVLRPLLQPIATPLAASCSSEGSNDGGDEYNSYTGCKQTTPYKASTEAGDNFYDGITKTTPQVDEEVDCYPASATLQSGDLLIDFVASPTDGSDDQLLFTVSTAISMEIFIKSDGTEITPDIRLTSMTTDLETKTIPQIPDQIAEMMVADLLNMGLPLVFSSISNQVLDLASMVPQGEPGSPFNFNLDEVKLESCSSFLLGNLWISAGNTASLWGVQ